MQLKIYVPKHPLIVHLASLMQNADIPPYLVRSSAIEITNWLCYEAMRDWISLTEVQSNNIDGTVVANLIDPEKSILAMPLIKSGLLMSASIQKLSLSARLLYVNFRIRSQTQTYDIAEEDKLAMGNLSNYSKLLILDSVVLSPDRILALLSFMQGEGVDLSLVRIIFIFCTSGVLQEIGKAYPELTIYTSCIKDTSSQLELSLYERLLDTLQT
nr:hypothetical protein [Porphyrostromium japonicum]